MLRLAVPAVLIAALLAGCAGDPEPADLDPTLPGTQTEEAAPFTVESLNWQVGDWWSHHWTSEASNLDFTVKSIVVANESGAYGMATDNLMQAAQHGAFFFMDLGTMDADGTMRSGEFAFPWYQFPLTHNKTWTGQETNVGDDFGPVTRTIDFTASQMGTGNGAHFMVRGLVDGKLYVEYDYKPELGWLSEFQSYDLDPETGEPVPNFNLKTESQGKAYSGAHYASTGELLVNAQTLVHPGSTSAPAQDIPFTLGSGQTHVFGLLFSFGAAGGHRTQITAPDGQHWETTAVADADGNSVSPVPSGNLMLTGAQAGSWRVSLGGAGLVSGGGAFVWGVTVTEGSL